MSVWRYMRAELRRCADEITRLRARPHAGLAPCRAVALSVVAALLGNAVVVADRLTHSEWPTFVGVPLIVLTGAALLVRRGWRWRDLGWRRPAIDPPTRVVLGALLVGAAWASICAVAGMARGAPGTPGTIARILIATAGGEELLHRGVLLGAWLSTGVRARWIVAANAGTFGLWHVAGAFHDERFHVLDVIGPALGALPLLWMRLRSRTVLGPAALHAGVNMSELL